MAAGIIGVRYLTLRAPRKNIIKNRAYKKIEKYKNFSLKEKLPYKSLMIRPRISTMPKYLNKASGSVNKLDSS